MASQSHGSYLWRENAGSGAVPSVAHMVLRTVTDVATAWEHVAATDAQAIACDPGDGSMTIFDLTHEYFAVSDGAGGFELSPIGPADAILVDAGDGGLALVPAGLGVVQAGRFLPDSSGAVYPIRLDADADSFVQVSGAVRPYDARSVARSSGSGAAAGPVAIATGAASALAGSGSAVGPEGQATGAGNNGVLLTWSPGAALPAGLTFTGDANRTRLDSAGVLHPVSANVPRDNGYFYNSAGVLTAAWLLEDARTNAMVHCRDLTQAPWTMGNSTAHANAITGIDNTASASTVIPSAANVVHSFNTNVIASTNGLGQAVRLFIKPIGTIYGWTRIAAFTNNEATAYAVWVNLATGAIGTKDSHLTVAVTAVVNGYWRIDVSWLTVGTHANDILVCYFSTANGDTASNAPGDGVSGFGIDFAQWQADGGSVSSSSILTTSTAVTRAAESATLASVGTAGTFYEQYLDASGVLHDDVSAYTPGPLALTLGRAYTALKIAAGTQTLATMRLL